jgi:hypothetical protein
VLTPVVPHGTLWESTTCSYPLLFFARPTHTILAVGVPIPYKYPPVEDDSGFLFFVIATLLIKTYSSFEDIVYRIILVAVRYFLGSK